MNRSELIQIENFAIDRGCFACGSDNPVGLHMEFFTDGHTVFSWLSVDRQLCGWRRIVHGGIISTVLDEIMSWTAHHMIRKLILTKSIHVTFLKPVQTEAPLRVEGRVLRVNSEREAVLEGRLIDESEKICAKAEGTFALLTPRVARRLGVIEEPVIQNFQRHFKTHDG